MSIRKRPSLPTITFAQRLRKMMLMKGISQSELAREVGYSPTGVWNWLQGNTFPRPETLAKVADLLSVSEDWLREGDILDTEADPTIEQLVEKETIAAKIDSLRIEIAAIAGYEPDQVKLTLELNCG